MGIIYGLAAVRGMIDAVEGPMRQAFVPEMVGTEDLTNAIALNSTQFNAARIIGPAMGAGVIAALGYRGLLLPERGQLPGRHRRAPRHAGERAPPGPRARLGSRCSTSCGTACATRARPRMWWSS